MARPYSSPLDLDNAPVPLGTLTAKGGNFAAQAGKIVQVPLHKDVGLDLLSWSSILLVTLAMLALQWIENIHFSVFTLFGGGVTYGNHRALLYYALFWFGLTVWERLMRLDEEKRGVEPHTLLPGTSRFGLEEFLPVSPKVTACAVEPALAFLAGAVVHRLGFSMLGWVFMVSSVCFGLTQWRLTQQLKRHRRDMRNLRKEGLWESDLMKENVGQRASGFDATAGLPTGIDGLEGSTGKRGRADDEEDNAAPVGGAV